MRYGTQSAPCYLGSPLENAPTTSELRDMTRLNRICSKMTPSGYLAFQEKGETFS